MIGFLNLLSAIVQHITEDWTGSSLRCVGSGGGAGGLGLGVFPGRERSTIMSSTAQSLARPFDYLTQIEQAKQFVSI